MSLGDGTDVYNELAKLGIAEIIGFEPVADECEKLNKAAKSHTRYFPYFIGDGSQRTFHRYNYPMASSLYAPNSSFLDLLQNLQNNTRVIHTEQVTIHRLEDLPNLENAIFIEVDVQGADLDVLSCAAHLLGYFSGDHFRRFFVRIALAVHRARSIKAPSLQ